MNSAKGVKSGVPERVSISCLTRNNLKPVICNSGTNPSTYVTQKCQIGEQGLYDDHIISEKLYKVSVTNILASIILKPE